MGGAWQAAGADTQQLWEGPHSPLFRAGVVLGRRCPVYNHAPVGAVGSVWVPEGCRMQGAFDGGRAP